LETAVERLSRYLESANDKQRLFFDFVYSKSNTCSSHLSSIDKEFQAIVMYTYGGMHHSAKVFLNAICNALDPAVCLLSHSEFKDELRSHIAIAMQRGNAAIMIEDSVRMRMMECARNRSRYYAARRSRHRAPLRDGSSQGEQVDAACLMRRSPPRVDGFIACNNDSDGVSRMTGGCSGIGVDGPGVVEGRKAVGGLDSRVPAAVGLMDSDVAGTGEDGDTAMVAATAAVVRVAAAAGSAAAADAAAAEDNALLPCQRDAAVAAQLAAVSVCGDVGDVCMSGDSVDGVNGVGAVSEVGALGGCFSEWFAGPILPVVSSAAVRGEDGEES
jgi:hypothetical protein